MKTSVASACSSRNGARGMGEGRSVREGSGVWGVGGSSSSAQVVSGEWRVPERCTGEVARAAPVGTANSHNDRATTAAHLALPHFILVHRTILLDHIYACGRRSAVKEWSRAW